MFNKSFKAILFVTLLLLATVINAAQTVTYFHNDISGSPLMATDAGGNVVWKENYYPYGERLKNQEGQQVANINNKLWFTGKPHDEDTGLSYFGARYYDPMLGRFMGIDPEDFNPDNIHSFNRYVYANNNPYRYVDPDGHSPLDIGFLVYDIGKLGVALYKGQGIQDALVDVGFSALGVISPIPGTGQAFKTAKIVNSSQNWVGVASAALKTGNIKKTSISVDDALNMASNFLKKGIPIKTIETKSGVQFVQTFTENGQKITKRAGFDLNPNSNHVKQLGPHLNLQTQINGKIKGGALKDPHVRVDPKTIRKGDY